jgi:hypothetical protein
MKLTFTFVALIMASFAYSQNLVSSQSWTVGSGSVGIFNQNGDATQNFREVGENPFGEQTILWKAVADAAYSADGGWTTQPFSIDRTKMYRFSVWIKKTNSTEGQTYFGCNSNDILNLGSNTVNSNPYFWYGSLPQLNKWYLLVGYIHGSNDPSTSNYGAIYDGASGAKVLAMTDFKFSSTATTAAHRAYLYYDTNTSDRQYFYDPQVYQIASSQPVTETAGAGLFNGNVTMNQSLGIGTANPLYKLQVTGGAIALDDDQPLRGGGRWLISGNQAAVTVGTANPGINLRLFAGADNPRVYVDAVTGNVGVGSLTPTQKLTVNGTIYGKEVKVDLNVPGPDYVFEKDYKLPSLEEIKSYIDQYKHLPEVPSAKEMEQNGINVSEMNMILLKKVEELTLQLILQAEQDKELKDEVRFLKTEIENIKIKK